MALCLVDVMNPKAFPHHKRHSVDVHNRSLWRWYSRESRIYNAVWDPELKRFVKGPLWFCNIMAFDFDVPDDTLNAQDLQNSFLSKLESILGKPKYVIRNKNEYTEWQDEEYFTKYSKDGTKKVKHPKKFGCQVVYELDDSLQSQYPELVKLYHKVRLYLTSIAGADMNFKGHMLKNWENYSLFNVEKNDDHSPIVLKELAIKFSDELGMSIETIDRIFSLKPFETLDEKIPSSLIAAGNSLTRWYIGINSWKTKHERNSITTHVKAISTSRNETLFSWMRKQSIQKLENFSYQDYVGNRDFYSHCDIQEPLDEYEFETTKSSVMSFLADHPDAQVIEDSCDRRVLDIIQNPININFCDESETAMLLEDLATNKQDKTPEFSLHKGFMRHPEFFLSNIRSMFVPNFLTRLNEVLFDGHAQLYGDGTSLYYVIRQALYLTHFKVYHNNKNKSSVKAKFIRYRANRNLMKYLGFYHVGNIGSFGRFFKRIKDSGLLKGENSLFAISFYQQKFHCKNALVVAWINKIKQWLKFISSIKANKKSIASNKKCFITLFIIGKDVRYKKYFLFNNKGNEEMCLYCNIHIFIYTDKNIRRIVMKKYIIFDTETTGLDPEKHFVISIGLICVGEDRLGEYLNEISQPKEFGEVVLNKWGKEDIHVNPDFEFHEFLNWFTLDKNFFISEETIKIHGITEDYLRGVGKNPIDVIADLEEFLRSKIGEEDEAVFIAFNLPYDINMISANLACLARKYGSKHGSFLSSLIFKTAANHVVLIDSLTIDRIFHFEVNGVKVRHNLDAVGARYGLGKDIHAHDALADSKRTTLVWERQLEELSGFGIPVNEAFEDRLASAYIKNESLRRNRKGRELNYYPDVNLVTA